jgi:hypothetical protein
MELQIKQAWQAWQAAVLPQWQQAGDDQCSSE